MYPAEYGFKFFAKIVKAICVFYFSSCISFNSTSHLKTEFVSKIHDSDISLVDFEHNLSTDCVNL